MGDIVKKMHHHMPETFFGHNVFLPAHMAITSLYDGAAIETVLFISFRKVRHWDFCLKISTKRYKEVFVLRYWTNQVILNLKAISPRMKNNLLLFAVLLATSLRAQYYYNDIIGTMETNRQMKTYLDNKVKTVAASGTDQRGLKATDFSEFHEVKENGRALKSTSIINLNRTVIYSRFDEQARIISMTDSSTSVESITTYEYDASGKIILVKNNVKDSANDFNQEEIHQWIYDMDGKPAKMWRIIKNNSNAAGDSLEIRFVKDEDGNIGEERTFRRNFETGYLYYYYDDKDRLSDIVRYNSKLKKLMPDILFEYDDNGRVVQKITTTSSLNLGYLIWRYIYDNRGLKTKEALFNKDKELTGRIDYHYTFNQ